VLGVPLDDQHDIATIEIRGKVASADELEEIVGVRELPSAQSTYQALLCLNQPEVRALGIPGGGGIMGAHELALFYQALLHNPDGVWHPDVLADATGTVRNRLPDKLFGSPASRTLGLVLAGDDGLGFMRGFGTATSGRAFGHGGAGGQIAWADPETGLSFAFATNGLDANVIRQARRGIELSTLAAACVADG
jgi:CubicO group peptidase (beta-lactamase class C family)